MCIKKALTPLFAAPKEQLQRAMPSPTLTFRTFTSCIKSGPSIEETRLTDEYVGGNYYTRLASRHFRNQMLRNPDNFDDFKTLAESTWPGLCVEGVSVSGTGNEHREFVDDVV